MLASEPLPILQEGLVLGGRYRVEGALGPVGRPGNTYRVTDLTQNTELAAKLLAATSSPPASEPLLRVHMALRDLPPEHFPREKVILQVKHEGRTLILDIRELVGGVSLARLVRDRGPLGADKTASLLVDLLNLAAVLQERQIVHGDINPHNVILEKNGAGLWLVDSGSLKAAARDPDLPGIGPSGWVFAVDRDHAAPEVLLGSPNSQTDIFGVGATVLFAMTGRCAQEVIRGKSEDLRETLTKEGCPLEVAVLVARLCELECGRRIESASAAVQDLHKPVVPDTAKSVAVGIPERSFEPVPGLITKQMGTVVARGLLPALPLVAVALVGLFTGTFHGVVRLAAVLAALALVAVYAVARVPDWMRPLNRRLWFLDGELRYQDGDELVSIPWRQIYAIEARGDWMRVEGVWAIAWGQRGESRSLDIAPVYETRPQEMSLVVRDYWRGGALDRSTAPKSPAEHPLLSGGRIAFLGIAILFFLVAAPFLRIPFLSPPEKPLEPIPPAEETVVDPLDADLAELGLARPDVPLKLSPKNEESLERLDKAVVAASTARGGPSTQEPPRSACPEGMVTRNLLPVRPDGKASGGQACFDARGTMVQVPGNPPLLVDWMEVTAGDYSRCEAIGVCTAAGRMAGCNLGVPGHERQPANCVNRAQARAWCESAGRRLCTQGEWIRAAGGPGGGYPWGTEAPSCARAVMVGIHEEGKPATGCGQGGTWTVGSRIDGVSLSGALDMSGNVAEWVSDGEGMVVGGSFLSTDPTDLAINAWEELGADRFGPDVGIRCCRVIESNGER